MKKATPYVQASRPLRRGQMLKLSKTHLKRTYKINFPFFLTAFSMAVNRSPSEPSSSRASIRRSCSGKRSNNSSNGSKRRVVGGGAYVSALPLVLRSSSWDVVVVSGRGSPPWCTAIINLFVNRTNKNKNTETYHEPQMTRQPLRT